MCFSYSYCCGLFCHVFIPFSTGFDLLGPVKVLWQNKKIEYKLTIKQKRINKNDFEIKRMFIRVTNEENRTEREFVLRDDQC